MSTTFAKLVAPLMLLSLAACSAQSQPSSDPGLPGNAEPSSDITLAAVEPDDGTAPVVSFIDEAKKSLDVVMYEFDPTVTEITSAMTRAQDRGVQVRVLLSRQVFPFGLDNHNVKDRKTLRAMGINVQLSNPKFSFSHQKSYLKDAGTKNAQALITDFNIGPAYFAFVSDPVDGSPHELGTRGLAVLNTNQEDLAEIAAVFEADWPPYGKWPAYTQPNLVWSPSAPRFSPRGNSIDDLKSLISSAQERIDLYVQAMQYPSILFEPLLDRVKAGVKVRIIGNLGGINSQAAEMLKAAGAQLVHNPHLKDDSADYLYIHSKTIVTDFGTDRQVAFVGSENPFLDQSLETERELGAFVTDKGSLAKIMNVFDTDFGRSQPYPTTGSPSASPS